MNNLSLEQAAKYIKHLEDKLKTLEQDYNTLLNDYLLIKGAKNE